MKAGLIGLILWAATAVGVVFPGERWEIVDPKTAGLDEAKLRAARDYALTGGGSGIVVHGGKVVMRWGDQRRTYDLKSSSKSIGLTAMGLALKDGKLNWSDRAVDRHPAFGVPPESNRDAGWLEKITLEHLAAQTAGFEKRGGYEPLIFEPGTKWHYSDSGPNWLAECVTLAYGRDVESLLFERVFSKLGITSKDLRWRRHAYRPREINGLKRCEFGSGVHANVDAMARIGLLYLREGAWNGEQLIPRSFVRQLNKPLPSMIGLPEHDAKTHGNASDHYSLLWWNNADGTLKNVPRDAYWSWGLYDSMIVLIPSLDLVVARAGKSWNRKGWSSHYDVLKPFFDPLVAGVSRAKAKPRARKGNDPELRAPYPKSEVVKEIKWAPRESIRRAAKGSDNWPITWGDDDRLYTAYGDGWGFEPKVPEKLSLGLATVTGGPGGFEGTNLRSKTIEQSGQGKHGRKASGMLMVDGALYMWVRNARNSQLAWSKDRGRTWAWASWKFATGFGCPTFLNFGKNYEGARDGFVYLYSKDSDSAYDAADAMNLARVPKDSILDRSAYRFFAGMKSGLPMWTGDIASRAAVFEHAGMCYRGGVSYSPGLKRYLWCQIDPDSPHKQGPRFAGGFGIYEAPEPWGPWSTVYFTRRWDVGPGETSRFPVKWMSADGRAAHLVFSGDDCFSVRRADFVLEDAR